VFLSVLRPFFTPWTYSVCRKCGERGDRSMHRRGNHACSFLFDKYHHLSYVAIVTAPSLVFPRGPCVVGGDLKRVVEAPNDVYHAHVRALADHSNQKKYLNKTHTHVRGSRNARRFVIYICLIGEYNQNMLRKLRTDRRCDAQP
jgi:hypothetical protein